MKDINGFYCKKIDLDDFFIIEKIMIRIVKLKVRRLQLKKELKRVKEFKYKLKHKRVDLNY